jgi:hypothetical protein
MRPAADKRDSVYFAGRSYPACRGSLASAVGFRRELASAGPLLRLLLPVALLGGAAGGVLLLRTPTRVFAEIVPYLVLFATIMVVAQRPLLRLLPGCGSPRQVGRIALFLGQLAVSIYGGYFGAGMGILMLAALGLYGLDDIHQRNGIKSLLAAVINGVAGIYFVVSGAIAWVDALALGLGAVTGGFAGAVIARRLIRRYPFTGWTRPAAAREPGGRAGQPRRPG